MDLEMLHKRASVIKQVRSFFDNKNYLELDTPLLSGDLIPESCLEVFQTERLYPYGSKKENCPLWLIPSPEIWMKKIIAQHSVNVYQICRCFRNVESSGHLHNCEFTMLEYYTMDADYLDSLVLTEALLKDLFTTELHGGVREREEGFLPFERVTMADAFKRWAGFDLFAAAAEGSAAMGREARRLGLDPVPGMTTPQLYDLIFIHAVEPHLRQEKPVALLDYPAFVPCLAKQSPDGTTVERWELYYNGIELANCFSEESDPQKVKKFFENEKTKKERAAIVPHKVDQNYWKLFEPSGGKGFPRCSGVAMGMDRLIMALTGRSTIDGVLPFALPGVSL